MYYICVHTHTCTHIQTPLHGGTHSVEKMPDFFIFFNWHFFSYNSITDLSSLGLFPEIYNNFFKPPAVPNHFLEQRF